jgi:hypothetical protein
LTKLLPLFQRLTFDLGNPRNQQGLICLLLHNYGVSNVGIELDIDQALEFLAKLDPFGRHTIASEAPFGRNGDPLWEGGATYEAHQRKGLIDDITGRQARGSNVYYGVNKPCPITQQQGSRGKCNVEDIVAIRALAFDVDFTVPKICH